MRRRVHSSAVSVRPARPAPRPSRPAWASASRPPGRSPRCSATPTARSSAPHSSPLSPKTVSRASPARLSHSLRESRLPNVIAAPLSIPSPPPDWKQLHFPVGEWLHGILPFVPEDWAIRITTYALVIIVGIFAAVVIANMGLTRRGAEPWVIVDVGIWAVVLGIVGARLYHVARQLGDSSGPDHSNPCEPLSRGSSWAGWVGGGAVFGALLGGGLGDWTGCCLTGLRFWCVADAIAPELLHAQAFGRLGSWFYQD